MIGRADTATLVFFLVPGGGRPVDFDLEGTGGGANAGRLSSLAFPASFERFEADVDDSPINDRRRARTPTSGRLRGSGVIGLERENRLLRPLPVDGGSRVATGIVSGF